MMGIHDRAYMQGGSGAGRGVGAGLGGARGGLSFTTILIVLNVAVYLVDGMLGGLTTVPVRNGPVLVQSDLMTPSTDPVIDEPRWGEYGRGSFTTADVVDRSTQRVIGGTGYRWMRPLEAYGHFSTVTAFTRFEIWRFVTFQFLHDNFLHLAFNMLGLYFFGPLVERWFGSRKRFAAFYLACGMMGAAAYLFLNLLGNLFGGVPGFLPGSVYVPLVGASAGVFGVLLASAKLAGEARMLVMFVVPMKVSTGAYLLTAIAAFNLIFGGTNAGGDAAHLGGAIAGFVLIRRSHWLNDFFDVFGGKKDGSGGGRSARGGKKGGGGSKDEAELNRILDKVKAGGTDSLSEKEKVFLERMSAGL